MIFHRFISLKKYFWCVFMAITVDILRVLISVAYTIRICNTIKQDAASGLGSRCPCRGE